MATNPPKPWSGGFPNLTQIRALRKLGLNRAQRKGFFKREMVIFEFFTGSFSAIGGIQVQGIKLRSGIISIHHIGRGLGDFIRFRRQSLDIAKAFGLMELELFGGAIINPRLEALLLRQGFSRRTETIPDALGGGMMEILSKVFPVK